MLRQRQTYIVLAITKGVEGLILCHFPAVRNFDQQRNPYLLWEYNMGVCGYLISYYVLSLLNVDKYIALSKITIKTQHNYYLYF